LKAKFDNLNVVYLSTNGINSN